MSEAQRTEFRATVLPGGTASSDFLKQDDHMHTSSEAASRDVPVPPYGSIVFNILQAITIHTSKAGECYAISVAKADFTQTI